MGLIVVEIIAKIIGGILCAILLPISIIICSVKSLIDGICYGDWHRGDWETIPYILRQLRDHFKSPIFN